MKPAVVRCADVSSQPWRNGGGVTRQLLAWPSNGDWLLRISVADIERDGPFSAFPGVARWFAVLQGAGVCLQFADTVRRIEPGGAPLPFDGALAPGCTLVDGPTRDLNLMLRGLPGALRAAQPGEPWRPATPMAGLFSLDEGRCVIDGEPTRIDALSLLWFDAAPPALAFDGRGYWIEAGTAR